MHMACWSARCMRQEINTRSQTDDPSTAATADNSIHRTHVPTGDLAYPPSSRMLNPHLAGGAMLDLGIYSLSWILQILYRLQPPTEPREPPAVVASSIIKTPSGVDESASFILTFPRHKTMGMGMTTLRVGSGVDYDFSGGPAIKIQGSRGEIQVCGPAFRPHSYRVITLATEDGTGPATVSVVECPVPGDSARGGWGRGLFWEADECARCVRDGRIESETMPLDETVLAVEVMEEMLMRGGVRYPAVVTGDVYDPMSVLNTGRG